MYCSVGVEIGRRINGEGYSGGLFTRLTIPAKMQLSALFEAVEAAARKICGDRGEEFAEVIVRDMRVSEHVRG